MQAVLLKGFGGIENFYIGETPTPQPKEDEVLIRVHATALNRADLLQRRGFYPPPAGETEILGLEAAGEVAQVGSKVTRWKEGDKVFALLPGGGYAQYVTVPGDMCMPVPPELSYEEAASIPEVFLTAFSNLFWLGNLTAGKKVLIHAGASGVGTAAIQLVRDFGGTSFVTASTQEKIDRCRNLGADAGWNYRKGSFLPFVKEQTQGQGVDIILDFIGAPYFADNIQALALDGRLIIVGTMGGTEVGNVNLGYLLAKRLQVIGTALRSRSLSEKIRLTAEFTDDVLPRFREKSLKPIVDSVWNWKEAGPAQEYMENNQNIGKIVLQVD